MQWKKSQINRIKQLKIDYEIKNNILHSSEKELNKHKIMWWNKFTLSIGCIVFFFIGAPLGAITRKGGLGAPVVISVVMFIIYYIIDNTGYKMAREALWPCWSGMWLSSMVLLPIGIFLTYKAATDSALFNPDAWMNMFRKVKRFFYKIWIQLNKRFVIFKQVSL